MSASHAFHRSAAAAPAPAPRYVLRHAHRPEELRAVQRLRHTVFADGMGARLHSPEPGLDIDPFDAHCDHLLVRDEHSGELAGTYRLLPPEGARAAGRLYAEGEFDLSELAPLRDSLVEAGRSCVHPGHRDGAVIGLLWAGIARYLERTGHNWIAGCCSVPLADGGQLAAHVQRTLAEQQPTPDRYRVRPLRPWQAPDRPACPDAEPRYTLPPLLRGYLRLGARCCGEPAYDAEFGVADFYMLLSFRDIAPRYLRHFRSLAAT